MTDSASVVLAPVGLLKVPDWKPYGLKADVVVWSVRRMERRRICFMVYCEEVGEHGCCESFIGWKRVVCLGACLSF